MQPEFTKTTSSAARKKSLDAQLGNATNQLALPLALNPGRASRAEFAQLAQELRAAQECLGRLSPGGVEESQVAFRILHMLDAIILALDGLAGKRTQKRNRRQLR